MKLLVVWLMVISLLGCEALFGIEVSPNIPEAASITSACSKLISVSQQIISATNSLSEASFGTYQLQNGVTSMLSSVKQTYTALIAIAQELITVTNANSGNLDTLFTNLQSNLAAFSMTTITVRFAAWFMLLDPSAIPDTSIVTLTLNDVSTFFNSVVPQKVKQFSASRISQATFYNAISKDQMSTFAQGLTALAQNQETVMVPFVNSVAGAFRTSNEKQTLFLTNADSAFQSAEATFASTYTRIFELNKQFRTAANEIQPTIRSSVERFTKSMDEFHDLYLGASGADYITMASEMYNSFSLNVTEQTKVVEARLELARNSATDNPVASFGEALAFGFKIVSRALVRIMQKATNTAGINCLHQAIGKFSVDYTSNLRSAFGLCISSSDYDFSAPVTAQMTTVKDIQNDMLQYFKMLNTALGGVSNSSPVSARIQADTFLTAYFSQRVSIMTTLMQQLVNMANELNVDYNLLIARSRYCLAMNVAVAKQLSSDFSQAIIAC
ncbi:uncharacterized protein LOC128725258 [Anopheles nili]|uniref:uncharacterized protein LOC128725258 n=1 Tax=Anopheles nili TaxID=185578 RepID=UPI00237B889F|nr:uncharacterized protein LOC128725258 [Anopheles nili]